MPNILLLGTDHRYQFRDPSISSADMLEFERLISETCTMYDARLVAEEMSVAALNSRRLSELVPAATARSLGLAHLYCDPSPTEQLSRGIADENAVRAVAELRQTALTEVERLIAVERRKREPIWLEKLEACALWPALFIFGSWHSPSFSALLHDRGFSFTFVHSAWQA